MNGIKLDGAPQDRHVGDWVTRAIRELLQRDAHLLRRDVNERSITHRLAVYLEREVDDGTLAVDCEYNRDGVDPKAIFPVDAVVSRRATIARRPSSPTSSCMAAGRGVRTCSS